jgi:TRAP-type C4-dicarboxylate transport system permease small subunit
MRKALDAVYDAALAGTCLAMLLLACLVLAQVLGRLLDRIITLFGYSRIGFAVPSLAEIGGFLFGVGAFLALAPTLRSATHIRVTLALRAFGPRGRRIMTGIVLLLAIGLTIFAAWALGSQTLTSWQRNSLSFGMFPIALWIPQVMMTLGLVIFLIAQIDELVALLGQGEAPFQIIENNREATEAGGH